MTIIFSENEIRVIRIATKAALLKNETGELILNIFSILIRENSYPSRLWSVSLLL